MATKRITVTEPKEGQPPTETLVLQWLLEPETVNVSTTTPSTTAVEGSTLQIDDEYMIVTDASAPDRLVVKRGAFETEVVEHLENAEVLVWGKTESGLPGKHPLARSELKGVGATMTRQMSTGEEATATRSRNIVDWPPPLKTHAEHVAELEDEAQKQEDFNNEQNAMQTEMLEPFREAILRVGDPSNADDARASAMEQFKASVAMDARRDEAAGARATLSRDADAKKK